MSSIRKELIALATTMPEPGLWTAYVTLKTVKEICDASETQGEEAVPHQSRTSNVIDIRSGREIDCEPMDDGNEPLAPIESHKLQSIADSARDGLVADGAKHLQVLCRHIDRAETKGQSTKLGNELFQTFLQSLNLMHDLKEKISRL
jgi:hypothetical protein